MFFFYDIGRDDFLHRKRCEIFYCADVRISHAKIIHMKDKGLGSHCRIGIGMDGMKNQGRHKYKISCIDRVGAKLYLISAVSVCDHGKFSLFMPVCSDCRISGGKICDITLQWK